MDYKYFGIILYFAGIITTYYIMKLAGYSLKRPSIPSVLFIFYFGWSYIGYLMLFLGISKYHDLTNEVIVYKMFLGNYGAISAIFIGILCSSVLLKRRSVCSAVYSDFPIQIYKKQFIIYFFLMFVSILVVIKFWSQLKTIPLLALIQGSSYSELQILRSEATSSFQGKAFLYYSVMEGGLPFLSYFYYAYYLINKTIRVRLIWYCILGFTLFVLLQALVKGSFVIYLFGLLITNYLVLNKKISWKVLVGYAFVALVFVMIFYSFILGRQEGVLENILVPLGSRAFIGQIRSLYYYYEMFPTAHDYLLGQSLGFPGFIHGLLFDERYRITVEVMNYIHPGRYIDRVGKANTVYWGEIMANFSYWLVIPLSFLIGLYIGTVQIALESRRSLLSIALLVYLSLYFKSIAATGVSILLPFNSQLLVVVGFSFLIFLFGRKKISHLNRGFVNVK